MKVVAALKEIEKLVKRRYQRKTLNKIILNDFPHATWNNQGTEQPYLQKPKQNGASQIIYLYFINSRPINWWAKSQENGARSKTSKRKLPPLSVPSSRKQAVLKQVLQGPSILQKQTTTWLTLSKSTALQK